jgi:tetratricopeptide (TPR) repeat protein
VSSSSRFRWLIFTTVLALPLWAAAQDQQATVLDQKYQAAVADYDAGRYSQAAKELQGLLPYAPKSYEIHELLGMVFVSLSENEKALDQLKTAVQLNPDSAAARTNLGTILFQSGKASLAAEQFREALRLESASYDANHNLGEFYVHSGSIADAQPLLERAQQLQPGSYENGYDLAMADFLLGHLDAAKLVIQDLSKGKDTSELHNLLGQIYEKDGKFVDAANQYELAAHMDPSEENIFDWASELLLHMTYEPAIAVYQDGARRFPDSPRLWIGLGLALYSRGKYDDAVKALIKGADLSPADPRCYLFLSKAYDSSPTQADEVIQRFRRYAESQPSNALAQYYYAVSLWKGKRTGDATVDLSTVESLLRKSIALDDALPEAHVQLGNLYADQHSYEKSIPEYVRALELDPNLSDAHYRLGTDYVHVGQKDRAQKEFDVYQKLRAEHLAELDKERAEVQQFVYSTKTTAPTKP